MRLGGGGANGWAGFTIFIYFSIPPAPAPDRVDPGTVGQEFIASSGCRKSYGGPSDALAVLGNPPLRSRQSVSVTSSVRPTQVHFARLPP